MSFKEQLDSLRNKVKGHIKPESAQEELDELNGMLADIDNVEKEYESLSQENAKFKDKIVNMVLNQGDDKPPQDPSGSKPKSMEEFINNFEKEHKEEK